MKCLHCGAEQNNYLCDKCLTEQVLDKVFHELLFFKPENCSSPHIAALVSEQTEKYGERAYIPHILRLFPSEVSEYYHCRYDRITKDPEFEGRAIAYIRGHEFLAKKTQRVLYDLLDSYLRNDFIKPREWCDLIEAEDNLCIELYTSAGQYYAMIGDYDQAERVLEKASAYLADTNYTELLYLSKEKAAQSIQKLKADVFRYRTKKPYWPNTEERRRAVAMFYDEKGIIYPRIENKPVKIPENEFAPVKECLNSSLSHYKNLQCGAPILHHIGGLHKVWDGLFKNPSFQNSDRLASRKQNMFNRCAAFGAGLGLLYPEVRKIQKFSTCMQPYLAAEVQKDRRRIFSFCDGPFNYTSIFQF